MSIKSFFEKIGTDIESWFGSHQKAIQTVVADAQTAVSAASGVAAAAGETSVLPVLSGIADGLGKVGAAAAAEAQDGSLAASASTLTSLASGLVASGDIGVKDAATKSAIGTVIVKAGNVIDAVQAAVAATPAP